MSNIAEFVESLMLDVTQDIKSYVYYQEESGALYKVSSRKTELKDYKILEVPYTDVKELMSGKKRTSDFRVEYDTALKQLALKENTFEDNIISVNDRLYKIPESKEETDIKIQYSAKENYWRIFLDPPLRKNKHLIQRPNRINLHFSITAKNDPNILYNTFTVNLKELIDNDFFDIDCQFEFDPAVGEVSIYTAKYFDTYSCEFID